MMSITTMTMHRKGTDMPKVMKASGKVKKFPYTAKGKAAASAATKKAGSKSVGSKKSYG
jgi:hypothetical protein